MPLIDKNETLGIACLIVSADDQEKSAASSSATVSLSKKKLGEGSFAEVFAGSWNEQPVAIKKIKLGSRSPRVLALIKGEVTIHSQLNHHNLVKLFGFEEREGKSLYLVLEFMKYGSLFELLYRHKQSFSPFEWVFITEDTVAGLDYLHGLGILHRDLKTENILLKSHHGYIQAKIADFGLAIKAEDAIDSELCGTLKYLAPELVLVGLSNSESKTFVWNQSADIYALGRTLLAMITCKEPYEHIKDVKQKRSWMVVAEGHYDPLPSETPKILRDIIWACLKIDPIERINTKGIVQLLANDKTIFEDSMDFNIEQENLKAVTILITRNKELLNHLNIRGCTPLHSAVISRSRKIVDYLINAGAEINKCMLEVDAEYRRILPNMTALDLVLLSSGEDDPLAVRLINAGAKSSPAAYLHFAARNGRLDIIKKLLAADATLVHVKDLFNQTALLIAASKGHTEIVKLFIAHGVNVNESTKVPVSEPNSQYDNYSPLDWAIKSGNAATFKVLKQAGARTNLHALEYKVGVTTTKNRHMLFNDSKSTHSRGDKAVRVLRYDSMSEFREDLSSVI